MTIVLLAVAVLSFFTGWLMHSNMAISDRYTNPSLHEGRWARPVIYGQGDQTRVVWESLEPQPDGRERNHVHKIADCEVGPGLAHVDLCACGAKRYGVFGTWS